MSEVQPHYAAATPDPDDQTDAESASHWTECEQGHWAALVERDALIEQLRRQVATLSSQVASLSTGLCYVPEHHDLEADLMRANGEVRILSRQVRRLQAGDGGAF